MREIKFRAWGIVSKKMYDWETILRDKMMLPSIGLPPDECRLVYLQYTGLKSKNGKEIYEGDIIRYAGMDAKIYWDDINCAFKMYKLAKQTVQTEYLQQTKIQQIEVIGNIYENPELLKEKKR